MPERFTLTLTPEQIGRLTEMQADMLELIPAPGAGKRILWCGYDPMRKILLYEVQDDERDATTEEAEAAPESHL